MEYTIDDRYPDTTRAEVMLLIATLIVRRKTRSNTPLTCNESDYVAEALAMGQDLDEGNFSERIGFLKGLLV